MVIKMLIIYLKDVILFKKFKNHIKFNCLAQLSYKYNFFISV